MPWNPARLLEGPTTSAPAVTEFVAALSRQKRLGTIAFMTVFCAVMVFGWLLSDRYEAQMEILVDQTQLHRADPVITSQPDAQPIVNGQTDSSDEVLNSEMALLRSENVLRQVVVKSGLNSKPGIWDGIKVWIWNQADHMRVSGSLRLLASICPMLSQPTPDEITAKAMRRVASKLSVEALKMSDVIAVSYRSNNPRQAAQVLNTLGSVYLQVHAQAHHPAGEVAFFRRQTDQARSIMEKAEQKLVDFTHTSGVASGQIQLNNALKQMSDTQANLDQTHADIAGTIHRIHSLTSQAAMVPQRLTTQKKTSDSALLLQQVKTQLLSLELKRTELLTKFQPDYPLVAEVNEQIAQAKASLENAEKSPVQEETTDRDPNYELLQEDLTRSNANLAMLEARALSLVSQKQQDEDKVQTLQQQTIAQQDLMRNARAAEDNYSLLLHKQEEARISDQLDKEQIFNVNIVQPASVPVLPEHSAAWYVIYGVLLATLCGFATATAADWLDPTLRTPGEVELILSSPVLAELSIPAEVLPKMLKGNSEAGRRVINRFLPNP